MMCEHYWLTSNDPIPLLTYLQANHVNRNKRGRKKLRLFGIGCASRVRQHMSERGRNWLDLGHRLCAENAKNNQLRRNAFFQDSWLREGTSEVAFTHGWQADIAAWFTLSPNVMSAAEIPAYNAAMVMGMLGTQSGHSGDEHQAEQKEQAQTLRDLFGNPFGLTKREVDWKTPRVIALTRAAYDTCTMPGEILEPDRLAVLADALEEAGCTNADVLDQCRGTRPLIRDCWIMELLLDLP